ncbi:hypothetical protein [Chitinophaga sp. sic0106]|uniref:hypothetical protein n=1 Tax=Chitinophaga sp. sic0106 TaxID=2854785 RepID=UPI001C47134F|nr:hypothetical protein [Chitinophaga sp. sic0106]MBV7530931.1 hypothetical protein [Chitinophaga sp. sic0106]
MKESKLYQTIKKDFKAAGFTFNEYNFDLKPAWRFAYYNPARKPKKGEVLFRTDNPTMYLIIGFSAVFFVISLLYGEFKVAYEVAVITAIIALVAQLIMKQYDLDRSKSLIISREGISTDDKHYRWEDYELAYIAAIYISNRQKHAQLIFIQNDEPVVYIDISHWDISRIATVIRDYQPPRFKQGLL